MSRIPPCSCSFWLFECHHASIWLWLGGEILALLIVYSLSRGPLIFCLLLSMFLSMSKGDQSSLVFSGVFSIVWIGEAVVTAQIKLLGGNMYVFCIFTSYYHIHRMVPCLPWLLANRPFFTQSQIILPISLFNRLHTISIGDCFAAQRSRSPHHPPDPCLPCSSRVVSCSRREYPGRVRSREKSSRARCLSAIRILYWNRLSMLYQLRLEADKLWGVMLRDVYVLVSMP